MEFSRVVCELLVGVEALLWWSWSAGETGSDEQLDCL